MIFVSRPKRCENCVVVEQEGWARSGFGNPRVYILLGLEERLSQYYSD